MDDIGRAQALEDMTLTDGWQILLAWLQERIDALEGTLLRKPVKDLTLELLRDTRLEIDTLRGVLCYVDSTIEDGRQELSETRPP